jgi:hypothetical protein
MLILCLVLTYLAYQRSLELDHMQNLTFEHSDQQELIDQQIKDLKRKKKQMKLQHTKAMKLVKTRLAKVSIETKHVELALELFGMDAKMTCEVGSHVTRWKLAHDPLDTSKPFNGCHVHAQFILKKRVKDCFYVTPVCGLMEMVE